MAIHSSSLFDVEAPLRRRASGGWIAGAVPGGVRGFFNFWGDEPTIELAGGVVSILRPARTPFRVGPLPEAVAADGDRLRVSRCSSGELGVALLRDARVVLALGALPPTLDANVRVPAGRPDDLHVRVTLDGTDHQLREGEYRFSEPWHLYVQRVGRTVSEPGERSLVGIARAHPAVDREALIEAVRTLASAQVGYRA